MVTTVAPTIPVLAAMSIPTRITAMPRPPRTDPMTVDRLSSRVAAMRVRSKVTPISTNSGTAISVWLVTMPYTLPGRKPRSPRSNIPKAAPTRANTRATPARVAATE